MKTTEKSPINVKTDINEVTPEIDINNNSPLLIVESGSQWIDDDEVKIISRPGSKL
jgi:hypothetical protein